MSLNVPVVIDANVIGDGNVLRWLKSYRGGVKILPAIAYSECAIHAFRKNGDVHKLDALLNSSAIIVEPMTKKHGVLACYYCSEHDQKWKKRWRDFIIAAYAAYPPHVVLTFDDKDFSPLLGDRAKNPYDFMKL